MFSYDDKPNLTPKALITAATDDRFVCIFQRNCSLGISCELSRRLT